MSQLSPKPGEKSPEKPVKKRDDDETVIHRTSRNFPQLAVVLAVLLICVVPTLNVGGFLHKNLFNNPSQAEVTSTDATAPERVDIPVSKSQISTAGQPLTSDQWIQVSLYTPNSDACA